MIAGGNILTGNNLITDGGKINRRGAVIKIGKIQPRSSGSTASMRRRRRADHLSRVETQVPAVAPADLYCADAVH